MSDVRQVTSVDVDAVVSTVASAFAVDPAWEFMVGTGNRAAAEAFARALLLPRVLSGTAWLADDGAAVAMWDRRSDVAAPGFDAGSEAGSGSDTEEGLWERFRADVGEEVWRRISVYEAAVDAVAPARPHWYLGVLATRPGAQGTGLASAVMRRGFEAAAADGWDCWLETSTVVNKAFYIRRGFTEMATVQVPGGPPTWWMRRVPQPV